MSVGTRIAIQKKSNSGILFRQTLFHLAAFVFGQGLEPLTQQYQLGLQVKELKVGREIRNQHLRASEQEVAQQVRQFYCQIVEDESGLKSAQADIDLYAELERVTKI